MQGLELTREYATKVALPELRRGLGDEAFSRIAVGSVGDGSDRFGFDDDVSRDHDWGVSLCVWACDGEQTLAASADQIMLRFLKGGPVHGPWQLTTRTLRDAPRVRARLPSGHVRPSTPSRQPRTATFFTMDRAIFRVYASACFWDTPMPCGYSASRSDAWTLLKRASTTWCVLRFVATKLAAAWPMRVPSRPHACLCTNCRIAFARTTNGPLPRANAAAESWAVPLRRICALPGCLRARLELATRAPSKTSLTMQPR